jgi:hypothetical protein
MNADFYSELIPIAKQAGVPTLIDSQKQYIIEAIKAQPEIVKMNWDEFEWTFGKKAATFEDLVLLARQNRLSNQIKNLVMASWLFQMKGISMLLHLSRCRSALPARVMRSRQRLFFVYQREMIGKQRYTGHLR